MSIILPGGSIFLSLTLHCWRNWVLLGVCMDASPLRNVGWWATRQWSGLPRWTAVLWPSHKSHYLANFIKRQMKNFYYRAEYFPVRYLAEPFNDPTAIFVSVWSVLVLSLSRWELFTNLLIKKPPSVFVWSVGYHSSSPLLSETYTDIFCKYYQTVLWQLSAMIICEVLSVYVVVSETGMGPFKNGICICIEFAFTFANFHEIENARKP